MVAYRDELIVAIKDKPELSSLDNSFVSQILDTFLAPIPDSVFDKYSSFTQCKRSKKCKELISSVRKHLRVVYGVFIKQPLPEFKNKLSSLSSYDDPFIDNVLQFHQSTHERHPTYKQVYKEIFSYLEKKNLPEQYVLGDFACGYNPFAYKFLPKKPSNYFVSDLSSSDMNFVQDFFTRTKISGKAIAFDLLSDEFSKFMASTKFDVVFLFKALDSLETVKRHSSKRVFSELQSRFIVVSFPSVTIGGNQTISSSKRWWFENFCTQNNWDFEVFSTSTEQFYLIEKN